VYFAESACSKSSKSALPTYLTPKSWTTRHKAVLRVVRGCKQLGANR
jgi:hypothetical protein